MTIVFTVYGTPIPQGSTKAFLPKGWKRPIITADNIKTKPWRQQISGTASDVIGHNVITRENGGVAVKLEFFFARPKSLQKKYTVQNKRPDIDKLMRAVLDALTGIAYEDDSQVCKVMVTKQYGTPERLDVTIDHVPNGEPSV